MNSNPQPETQGGVAEPEASVATATDEGAPVEPSAPGPERPEEDAANSFPELIVLLVCALGADADPVESVLDAAFRSVNYTVNHVRISKLLEDADRESGGSGRPSHMSKPRWLMELGDELRERIQRKDAAALLGMLEIRRLRGIANGGDEGKERARTITIVRSAKREEEVETFRLIYGSRLLVIGVSSVESERRDNVLNRLRRDHHDKPELCGVGEADDLLSRDAADENNPWGQGLREAFALADAFIWLRAGRNPADSVQRLVNLWFGKPFETPTPDEQAMFHARAAQYRSAAAGRQVGVSIIDDEGEVLVTGANDVPKPGGGQYWVGDDPDHRDFTLNYETNDVGKRDVAIDTLGRLAEARWLRKNKRDQSHAALADESLRKGGPLHGSRITDLIEFGRIMHAEMAAICTAARRGTPIGGARLYTTTYPCHECARLIIGAGIRRVVFVDPYPKSQVQMLFQHLVTDDPSDKSGSRVHVVPFEGVAPDLFPDVFQMSGRKRDEQGRFEEWVPSPLAVWGPNLPQSLSNEAIAIEAIKVTPFGQAWLSQDR